MRIGPDLTVLGNLRKLFSRQVEFILENLVQVAGVSQAGQDSIGGILALEQKPYAVDFFRCGGLGPGFIRQIDVRAESLRSLQHTDLTDMLNELSSLPTAVVHGSRDPARNLSHAESLSNGIPGSRLVVLETGHTSCVEAPDEFAEVIRSVVEQGLKPGAASAD